MEAPHTAARARPASTNRLVAGLQRGFFGLCPNCGRGAILRGYLKVNQVCSVCGLTLGDFRADDAPPYFTILVVGHLVVPAMLMLEISRHPPEWVHLAIWLPLTLIMTLALLPRVKGAVIGAQWAAGTKG